MGTSPSNTNNSTEDNIKLQNNPQCTQQLIDEYNMYKNNPLTYTKIDENNGHARCGGDTINIVFPIQWFYIILSIFISAVVSGIIGCYIGMKLNEDPKNVNVPQ